MKIKVLSDLHLEFAPLSLSGGDILFLAGDICVANYLKKNRTDKEARRESAKYKQFFFEECAKYNKVYYVMGNHEHYNGVFNNTADILREFLIDTNVTLLDKELVDLNDEWQIFGATFWTDFNNDDWFAKKAASDFMNDHTVIKYMTDNESLINFSTNLSFLEHKNTLDLLSYKLYEEYDRMNKKTIILSHHAPTSKSVHPYYIGQATNHAYYSDLDDVMLDNENIKYWFHGHMHDNFDYMVGECRVICNPRGYQISMSKYSDLINETFDPNLAIEI